MDSGELYVVLPKLLLSQTCIVLNKTLITGHPPRPDFCDGGFDQYCDSKRRYSNISLILVDSGRADLLEYMSDFWKDFRGDDEDLWEHEWNKHGTCISTLETTCYADYYPQQEVVDYFNKTVEIFQKLPTYQAQAPFDHYLNLI